MSEITPIAKPKELNICFLSPGASQLLNGSKLQRVIGPDVFCVMIGRELVKHGYQISFITSDERNELDIEEKENMRLINAYKSNKRYNVFTKMLLLWRAMKIANPDLFYHHGSIPGIGVVFAKLQGKRIVHYIGSDALVNRKILSRSTKEFKTSRLDIVNICNQLDLLLADQIIVQNEYQTKYLTDRTARKTTLIKKPVYVVQKPYHPKLIPQIVLWVGSIAEVKQPELVLKLAKANPHTLFKIIGGNAGCDTLCRKITEESKVMENVEYIGVVPFEEIDTYFEMAYILINTSLTEAYPPIAALQAWMNYTPVVSLGDNEDEIIQKYGMGFHSRTIEQMNKDILYLIENEDVTKQMGLNGRKYVEEEHCLDKIIDEHTILFTKMFDRS